MQCGDVKGETAMTLRSLCAALGLAALTLAAGLPAVAQSVETRGVVQRVDVASGTVYFTDGRTVRLEPGSKLAVDGRPVSLADVQPGWTLVVPGVAAGTAPSVTAIATPPPARPVAPPVDATGVVSRVDPQTGTVVLEDGRVLQATGRTTIWQSVPLSALKPGTSVHMRNAEALDFRPGGTPTPTGTATPAGTSRFSMGTVSRVDPAGKLLLSDGTVVPLTPGTRVDMNGQTLMITDLRPGDEVVIGGALPGAALVAVPLEVHVVRRSEAP
jgi:hypothetical protein